MNKQTIRNCERAHYIMQLSSYFSELTDLPGISFAYTNLVTDTWYNQAYNIHSIDDQSIIEQKEDIFMKGNAYFTNRDRKVCFYITPATTPEDFSDFLEEKNFVVFDEEAWMFYDLEKNFSHSLNTLVSVKKISENELDIFGEVYRNTLPGPEVNAYIQCVKNGLLSHPPLIEINYYLAYIDKKPVGMLSLLSTGKYAGVYAVAVDEHYQQQGICTALVAKVIEVCREKNIEYLFLQTGDGEESQKAFEKLGFTTEFIRKGYIHRTLAEDVQHG